MGWHDVVKDLSLQMTGAVHIEWHSIADYIEHGADVTGMMGRIDYRHVVHFHKGKYLGSGDADDRGRYNLFDDDAVCRYEMRRPDLRSRLEAKWRLAA
jgi:hypothetical protein